MNRLTSDTDEVSISRARLDSITVYDVTEDELEMIERGSPSSNYLSISISLLSVFFAFLITLLTVPIESNRTFTFFLLVTIVTFVVGVILLMIWFKTNKSSKTIFKKIRSRKSSMEVRNQIVEDEIIKSSGETEPSSKKETL